MKAYKKVYRDQFCEAVKHAGAQNVIIKDIRQNKYYEVPESELSNNQIKWENQTVNHSIFLLVAYYSVFLILLGINIAGLNSIQSVKGVAFQTFIPATAGYMLVFITLHELGHYVACRCFGRKPERIGFKLNYVFPAIYIRMNEVYFLDKIEKLYVHSAGLMCSLLINSTLFIIAYFKGATLWLCVAAYTCLDIFMNMIPLLNSDGYKILITLLNVNEKKNIKYSSKVIILFRIANYVIASVYTIWFVKNYFLI